MQFYHYLIYRLYTWRMRVNDKTPGLSIILMMSILHIIQLLTVYLIVIKIFPSIHRNYHLTKTQVVVIALLTFFSYYLLVYNKERWNGYIEKFKDETPQMRRKGTFWVNLFTVGTVILFFITGILLFIVYDNS